MKHKLKRCLVQSASIILLAILLAGTTLAGGQTEVLIDVETDDIQIEQLDISHLEVGDSETIYTDDGRALDILRTAHGVEIFIDGEKLDIPSADGMGHNDDAEMHHKIVIEVECDSDRDDDCSNHHFSGDNPEFRNAEHHKVIIVKEIVHQDDEI